MSGEGGGWSGGVGGWMDGWIDGSNKHKQETALRVLCETKSHRWLILIYVRKLTYATYLTYIT